MKHKRDTFTVCPICGSSIHQDGVGRYRKYCSDACKVKAYRRKSGTQKRKEYNTVRTDTLEGEIALAAAKCDYGAESALRRLAKLVGAPIDESRITVQKNAMLGVLSDWRQADASAGR